MFDRQGKQDKLIQSRWYFLGYAQDIDISLDATNTTHIFSIYGQRFALWRSCDRQLTGYLLPQAADFYFKSFPVVEKQGSIWLWYGEQKLADENLITIMDSWGQASDRDN